jgi:hypothetical protein
LVNQQGCCVVGELDFTLARDRWIATLAAR